MDEACEAPLPERTPILVRSVVIRQCREYTRWFTCRLLKQCVVIHVPTVASELRN